MDSSVSFFDRNLDSVLSVMVPLYTYIREQWTPSKTRDMFDHYY